MANDMTKRLAPDGGPLSEYRAPNTLRHKTIRVEDKETKKTFVIAENDFDASRYNKVAPVRERLDDDVDETAEPEFGTETRDELMTLTIDALKEKPEFAAAGPAAGTTKEEIVDAILAVREAAE